MWFLQGHIINDTATVNGMDFTLDSFCYKPISGEGCIVESPMQYFLNQWDILQSLNNTEIKTLATCVKPLPGEQRACFDSIGSPILTFAIFGDTSCENEATECDQCRIDAGGMQFTMLLNHNAYSQFTAEEWEKQVFIRNIKSFNKAIDNGYHTDMSGPEENLNYNWVLIQEVRDFIEQWNADPANEKMVEVKADYLSERSI